jgi:hypothetical protein
LSLILVEFVAGRYHIKKTKKSERGKESGYAKKS